MGFFLVIQLPGGDWLSKLQRYEQKFLNSSQEKVKRKIVASLVYAEVLYGFVWSEYYTIFVILLV